MKSIYYVRDILQKECFHQNCNFLYADEKSLSKVVRWCYRLTSLSRKPFHLLGDEFFFLSSDVLIEQDEYLFIKQLILSNCSGLCIDASAINYELQRRTIEICKENHFPIIICNKLLPFGLLIPEINQEILEIQGSEKQIEKVEEFYRILLEIEGQSPLTMGEEGKDRIPSLTKGSNSHIINYLEILKEYTEQNACYWHILSYPVSTKKIDLSKYLDEDRLRILDKCKENDVVDFGNCSVTTIKVLDERYAYIILYGDNINSFNKILLLKLTSFLRIRIISAFIKRLQIQLSDSAVWMKQWLNGTLPSRIIQSKIKENNCQEKYKGYFVAMVKIPEGGSYSYSYRKSYETDYHLLNDNYLLTSMLIFRMFRRQGFRSFQSIDEDVLTYIILIPETMNDVKRRFQEVTEKLNNNPDFLIGNKFHVGVGKIVTNADELNKSAKTALEAMNMKCIKDEKIIFYDLSNEKIALEDMKKQYHLTQYVEDNLKELLNPENKDLLDTLKEFFLCNGEKKKTAEKIHVVRATLYTRLKKIEEITEKDLDNPHQRLALFLAISAIDYVE